MTATNQSGLGAIMEVILNRGCVLTASNSFVMLLGETPIPPPEINVPPAPPIMIAWISSVSVPLPPNSAITLIPSVAKVFSSNKLVSELWVIPINPEKWGLEGKSVGCVSLLQTELKVMV